MAHVRQQIRDALVTLLTGLATTGSNVFAFRIFPQDTDVLPSINITTPSDSQDKDFSSTSTIQTRTLIVPIEIRAKATTFADVIDTIALEVEEKIVDEMEVTQSTILFPLVVEIESTIFDIDISSELDTPTALGILTFEATYKVDTLDLATAIK